MSIFSSLYIGMSGMRTHESAIGVIGNNIANVNTIGYKGSRAVFADLLSANVLGSAGPSQAGQGAALAQVQRVITQGAMLGTNVPTDLAISGDGYLIADDAAGNRVYTRNGQLQADNQGFLTTIDNLRMQGYTANPDGTFAAALGPLQIGAATSPPNPTSAITIVANLNQTEIFDPQDPPPPFTTPVTVYDSLGRKHALTVTFTQTGPGEWSWTAESPQGELDGTTDTTQTVVASGTLSFDSQGRLRNQTQTVSDVTYSGANPQTLAFDFGDATDTGGDGTGTNAFAGASAVATANQDGYGVGDLSYVEIGSDGVITGTFSNGEERALGRVALARFEAPNMLTALGGNNFAQSRASGDPAIGDPGTGGRGELMSGALEQSNVDLTNEFTDLILAQRGFQASSRIITTADEMLTEVVNLKR